MDLPLLAALFLAFALIVYLVLDGFDLGVGALLLTARREDERDLMIASIGPIWDGNETWLIMAGVTLLAAFPMAYAILLPAFYLPLVVMLLSLGLRGVSFEFREQAGENRRVWDYVFAIGSISAALCQGVILGGLIEGVAVEEGRFAGGSFDFLSPFSCITALAVLVAHANTGLAWLHARLEEELAPVLRRLVNLPLGFCTVAAISVFWAASQPRVAEAWETHTPILTIVCVAFVSIAIWLRSNYRLVGARSPSRIFGAAIAMLLAAMVGLAIVVFPFVIPFKATLWEAASETASITYLLVGALVVTPFILAYSAFGYWVFRPRHARGSLR